MIYRDCDHERSPAEVGRPWIVSEVLSGRRLGGVPTPMGIPGRGRAEPHLGIGVGGGYPPLTPASPRRGASPSPVATLPHRRGGPPQPAGLPCRRGTTLPRPPRSASRRPWQRRYNCRCDRARGVVVRAKAPFPRAALPLGRGGPAGPSPVNFFRGMAGPRRGEIGCIVLYYHHRVGLSWKPTMTMTPDELRRVLMQLDLTQGGARHAARV
jgi:hypothetical protein